MKSLSETLIGRVLGLLATAVTRHRRLFLWPQFVLFALCVAYTAKYLQFDTNRDDLVGADKTYHKYFLKYKSEFPAPDDLAVVVESDDHEKNRQFVERLGHKLDLETNLFKDVVYRHDLKALGPKGLQMASVEDLHELRGALTNFLPFIAQFTKVTNLDSMFALVNYQIYHAKKEANAENDALLGALPMLTQIASQATDSLKRPGEPPSPGLYALFGGGNAAEKEVYETFANGRIFLASARAREDDLNEKAIVRLRALVTETLREVPGVNAGITGEPVLENDEMQQSQRDSTLASIVSLVICALIFIYGYQQTGRPLKATLCLLVGLGYTLAFTTLVVGHLNILTITFVPILIGLAIDFGVHLITRYEEELHRGASEAEAMRIAMVFTGQGIFTGALTTAFAFLAMFFTNFKGIQEMGVICGGGMIVCFIPMITLLPVLLMKGRQNALDHIPSVIKKMEEHSLRTRIEGTWLRRPKTVVIVTIMLTALSATQFHKLYFDYDLLNMQSKGLPAVEFEKKLIAGSQEGGRGILFNVIVTDTPEQALALESKLSQLPSVLTNISMSPFITGDRREKLRLIGAIKSDLTAVQFQPPDKAPVPVNELSRTLYSTGGYMGAAVDEIRRDATNNAAGTNALSKSDSELIKQLLALKNTLTELRRQMLGMDPEVAGRKLAAFQQSLFNDVRDTFQALRDQDTRSPMQAADLPEFLRNRFIGVSGKNLIMVYPKGDVWQHDVQAEFVRQVRTVESQVTGTPVQLFEYTKLLKDSYIQAAYYSLAAIALMVLIHFRNIVYVVLALLPVAIGTAWMGGIMGWFNIPFNPANIMTLPLVIGIGVTNGIHILNRFAEEHDASILSKSTGKAVFVSGLTAIAGFGSLILARHQGIRSLGEIMTLGVGLCMVAALTFLPAVLKLGWSQQNQVTKQPSGDNARSPLGREEPR